MGYKHTAVSSGVRYDLLERQPSYFSELTGHHVSGLLKIAPEHLVDQVTNIMRKPGKKSFETFVARFQEESAPTGQAPVYRSVSYLGASGVYIV